MITIYSNRISSRPAAIYRVVVAEVDSDSPHRVLTPPGRVLRTRPTALTAVGRLVVDEGEFGVVIFAAPLNGLFYISIGGDFAEEGVGAAQE